MEEYLSRMRRMVGAAALERLARSRVLVMGLGGVGSHAAEALARGGIGCLLLIDGDRVAPSNLNRQLPATVETIGLPKARAMAERLAVSAPWTAAEALEQFVLPEQVAGLLEPPLDYVVDAVDTVSVKLALAEECGRRGIPLISCMGTGNKLDPARFRVGDIYETDVCPLCRVMRRELRRREIPGLRVVWSDEPPLPPVEAEPPPDEGQRAVPGSVSFVPPVAGLIAAGEVLRGLMGEVSL